MKKVLVIQLCRLGDLLQTTPMLRGLRREHPEAEISLMVLDGFASAPIPSRLFDRLIVLPFGRLSASLRQEQGARWSDAVGELRAFVSEVSSGRPFDLVLNLTGSALANLLCAVIPSREVRGGVIAPDRSRVVRGQWMTYFWASLLSRSMGCINLVDLFQWTAGVGIDGESLEIDVSDAARTRIDGWLAEKGLGGARLIALQLGASDERKRWPPEQFAAMANRLPDDAGTIVFVGSASEQPLVDRAMAHLKRPAVSAAGETSVPELAALLARCRLLITNDTGTMHVASSVGTRIVDLSTGPVFVHETGPYGDGHVAVEPISGCFPCAAGSICHHMSCREDLTPQDVADIARFALGDAPCPEPPRVRILQASRTATGRIEYQPVWDPTGSAESFLRRALARVWESSLNRGPDSDCSRRAELQFGHSEGDAYDTDGLEALTTLATRATALAEKIERGRGPTGSLSAELESSLKRALTLGETDVAVKALVSFLRTEIESCTLRDVSGVARVYASAWKATADRARHLTQLAQLQLRPTTPA
jgi:ADP-heptose:LPS heptosyltransferase